ncbi:hypothetical protein ACVDHI_15935 [Aeromonas sp. 25-248]
MVYEKVIVDSQSILNILLVYEDWSWLLAFGFWLLAFGFWLLAFGFWLLAFGRIVVCNESIYNSTGLN